MNGTRAWFQFSYSIESIEYCESQAPAANFCVARESKRTIAKVSAPVLLVMGQVLRFYVVALRC